MIAMNLKHRWKKYCSVRFVRNWVRKYPIILGVPSLPIGNNILAKEGQTSL